MIKYGAAMSFAVKEELNALAIFRRCCSAANLRVLTSTAPISPVNYREADILHEPYGSNIGGSSPSGPMKSAPLMDSEECPVQSANDNYVPMRRRTYIY